MVILAIDQSTSATKAMLFSEQAVLLNSVSIPHEQYFPKPGWVEHDAEEIFRNLLRAVSQLKEKAPDTFAQVEWVSITNQRETIVVFDRETGKPLTNAIVWQDRRGEPLCSAMKESGAGTLIQDRTGLVLDTYFPASKLAWMNENLPEIGERLKNGTALMGTMDTFLLYRLTNGKAYATDHTNASRTLFYDIDKLDWDRELIDLFKLEIQSLPRIQESAAVFGSTDFQGLLDKEIPVAGVMGDSQAALFAEKCFSPGMAKVTFGTGSSVLMNIGSSRIKRNNGIVTAIAWVIDGKPTFALEGITNFTGATIAWLKDQLNLIDTIEESEVLAESVSDNGGVYFVPAFVGLGAPYWKSDATGAIFGLTPGVTKAHVTRAALEGIAFTVTDVLRVMEKSTGIKLGQLCADGGAVRNRFLMQFTADINQGALHASVLPELSALGAVFSGGIAMNVYRNQDDIRKVDTGVRIYSPSMDLNEVEKLYSGWNLAIKKIRL